MCLDPQDIQACANPLLSLDPDHPDESHDGPALRGSYSVRAEFDLPPVAGSGRKPAVEAALHEL
ncbi:hypothetical protein BH23GEM6_BH23GEM6_25020 [soil metagenome]